VFRIFDFIRMAKKLKKTHQQPPSKLMGMMMMKLSNHQTLEMVALSPSLSLITVYCDW